jgi:Fe-S cluster assembly ATP-binding protein
MLSIKNLHASIGDKEILKGINLEVKSRRSSCYNGSQRKKYASIIAGNENYEVTQGEIGLDEDLADLAPEERDNKAFSFRFNILLKFLSFSN